MHVTDPVLVTGATGYIGGRLVPRLLESGYPVRVMVRDPARLQGRAWADQVEVVTGDVFAPETLTAAMKGVRAAYYLIHSMSGAADFEERDKLAAKNFAAAAKDSDVAHVIYLGGLGDPQREELSDHLRSRHETGDVLREHGPTVTELRAAVIVGSGSASFEMIRNLAERVPVMICPRWVFTRIQPIGISDVLRYLVSTLRLDDCQGQIIEIGGRDVMTYGEIMLGYARARGLRRWLVPVPVLTPRLSSYWVHLVTPIPTSIARPLVEGLKNEVVVRDRTAEQCFPDIQPIGYDEAVQRTLAKLDAGEVATSWSDAVASSQGDEPTVHLDFREGMIVERRRCVVDASPEAIFRVVSSLGGQRGWLYANLLWRLRGVLDRLVGGVGFRRGRRDPEELRVGDAVDFWRVEAIDPGRLLRLRAEMKVPGHAWLEFHIESSEDDGTSVLQQNAYFAPRGLSGLAYWYLLYPVHRRIFSKLSERISQAAAA